MAHLALILYNNPVDASKRPPDLLKTPSRLDFLRASLRESPDEDTNVGHKVDKFGYPGTATTTAITNSPGRLLWRETLQAGPRVCERQEFPRHKESLVFHGPFTASMCDSSRWRLQGRTPKDGADLQVSLSPRTPSPMIVTNFVSQCPKSVMTNPLRYLEHYERNTHNPGSSGAERGACSEEGGVTAGREGYSSQASTSSHTHMAPYVYYTHTDSEGSSVEAPWMVSGRYDPVMSRNHHIHLGDEYSDAAGHTAPPPPPPSTTTTRHQIFNEGNVSHGNQYIPGIPTAQQDYQTMLQDHHHHQQQQHPNPSLLPDNQNPNLWQHFNPMTQQPQSLVYVTDPIFPSYLPSAELPPPPPPIPPRPPPFPPMNTDNLQCRQEVRDSFQLSPIIVKMDDTLHPSTSHAAAAAAGSHRPQPAVPSSSRHSTIWDAMGSLRPQVCYQQMGCHPPVCQTHSHHRPEYEERARVRDHVYGMSVCGGGQVGVVCCGGAGRDSTPLTSHPSSYTSHWHR